MSETSKHDKTEDATPQKIRKAREDGQVARSKDLGAASLIIGCSAMLTSSADWFASKMSDIAQYNMMLNSEQLRQPDIMVHHFGTSIMLMLTLLSPLIILVIILAALSGALPGGPVFSFKNASFKYSRIDPKAGLGRMVSSKALVELVKSTLKITLLIGLMLNFLSSNLSHLLSYSQLPIDQAVTKGVDSLAEGMLALGLGLLFIALIDVPYQMWHHLKELKMSRQEIKDEHKQQEGKPEVKSKIRQLQQKMGQSRAEKTIPESDVLLVNPTHYAVAIKYNPELADAPYVMTKGTDDLALYMRQVAKKHDVEIIELPALARAIYHSTQIDQQIPSALFMAIAHVLSYVLQIRAARQGKQHHPEPLPQFFIPSHLRQD